MKVSNEAIGMVVSAKVSQVSIKWYDWLPSLISRNLQVEYQEANFIKGAIISGIWPRASKKYDFPVLETAMQLDEKSICTPKQWEKPI